MGAACTRHSPRPLLIEGRDSGSTRTLSRRGNAESHLLGCLTGE